MTSKDRGRQLFIRHLLILMLLVGSVGFLGCREQADGETATPRPAATAAATTAAMETVPAATEEAGRPGDGAVVIAAILPGVPGNNNQEFVELYNLGGETANLDGWSLWYTLAEGQEPKQVYGWAQRADVPAAGSYLLVRAGELVGAAPDATFSQPLAVKGLLQLRDAAGEVVDQVAWGNVADTLAGAAPAAAPTDGASLVRQANGAYEAVAEVVPDNSGSRPGQNPLALRVPEGNLVSVAPGEIFAYPIYLIENSAGTPVEDVVLSVPVPAGFEVVEAPAGAEVAAGRLTLSVAEVAAGGRDFPPIQLQAPWTYTETIASGLYAEANGQRSYAEPFTLAVSGGTIPIGRARELVDETVTVEGVATMYTGGFFAGSTGTKFYLEDESGGIQVYIPGGMGVVDADIGERFQVTGKIELYRDSLEIIPATIPDDVVAVEGATVPVADVGPVEITIEEGNEAEEILGRLVVAEGTVTRIEEFSYSYEIDLTDEAGNELLVYVEKDTGVNVEPIRLGERYRITGISELYNGQWQLKPRLQRDFARVYPPELRLALGAPNTVAAGETATYVITATNYTGAPLAELAIRVEEPAGAATLAQVGSGGSVDEAGVLWELGSIEGNGGQQVVTFTVEASGPAGSEIVVAPAVATATGWPEPATTEAQLTFVGETVPIWAIQGEGAQSPYVLEEVTTAGVVTGLFPELGGFWIQETETDESVQTSAGVFVLTETVAVAAPAVGDRVQVQGVVRERSEQTLLEPLSAEAVAVLSQENALPEAVELVPPETVEEAEAYYESLEGMLVQVSEPAVVVGPTNRYGEFALVRGALGVERVYRGDPAGMLIFVDDGSEIAYEGQEAIAYSVNSGDRVSNVAGPLAYTFGQYKIEPVVTPTISARSSTSAATLPPLAEDRFSIATYNVENFFDLLEPHPGSPPAPTAAAYRQKLARTAEVIVAMGVPTIVALQEVENVGILEDLAAEPLLAAYDYQAVLVEGFDSRGIDVGYLVRGDRTSAVGAAAYDAPEGLTSRPPLVLTATLTLPQGERTVYVINNHFTSMAAGEAATEPRRTAQAAWAAAVMEAQILAEEPEAWVAVVGDLNSFYDSEPLETLRAAGLRHVYEFVAPGREYSYIYQGESETLDHILLTPALYEQLAQVTVAHVNADYAAVTPEAVTPEADDLPGGRVSDHDPVIAVFGP